MVAFVLRPLLNLPFELILYGMLFVLVKSANESLIELTSQQSIMQQAAAVARNVF
ncbi:hypothetical protein [Sodalis sp.]|uniref:hypothetical protein n=1 Tax=Sodalis sp. (in: enterobacteria) TaxID=1898979 RepID=UPI0038734B68